MKLVLFICALLTGAATPPGGVGDRTFVQHRHWLPVADWDTLGFTGGLMRLTSCLAGVLFVFVAGAQTTTAPHLDVPYVPSPNAVVNGMLKLADVKKGDVVYDLGCGDGRIVITAAKEFGAKGVGVDINPVRIQEARENAKSAAVAEMVKFEENDLFKANIADATVVTLYLLPDVNVRLRPKLLKELKPGTRIVSHSFDMGDWKPDKDEVVDGRHIYLWTVPEKH